MANVSVHEYVDSAIGDEALERKQVKDAGTIIAQFLIVQKGLEGRVANGDLTATAATLTAGIWGAGT